MYKQNVRKLRRSAPGITDAHGESINVSKEVKTTVVLMEDVVAARAAANLNHFTPQGAAAEKKRRHSKQITINV